MNASTTAPARMAGEAAEFITWKHVERDGPPCSDRSVHIAIDDPSGEFEPVWLGYFNGETWSMVDTTPISAPVVAWAEMLMGPPWLRRYG